MTERAAIKRNMSRLCGLKARVPSDTVIAAPLLCSPQITTGRRSVQPSTRLAVPAMDCSFALAGRRSQSGSSDRPFSCGTCNPNARFTKRRPKTVP